MVWSCHISIYKFTFDVVFQYWSMFILLDVSRFKWGGKLNFSSRIFTLSFLFGNQLSKPDKWFQFSRGFWRDWRLGRWSSVTAATSTPWRREVMSRCNSWKEILLSELSVRRATTPQRAVSNTLKLLNNWLKSKQPQENSKLCDHRTILISFYPIHQHQ